MPARSVNSTGFLPYICLQNQKDYSPIFLLSSFVRSNKKGNFVFIVILFLFFYKPRLPAGFFVNCTKVAGKYRILLGGNIRNDPSFLYDVKCII